MKETGETMKMNGMKTMVAGCALLAGAWMSAAGASAQGPAYRPVPPERLHKQEKPSVVWRQFCWLESGLAPLGRLATRTTFDIPSSTWSIGCETMDRDYAVWDAYKDYLPYLGAKRGRLFSGWAKTEREKGVYDFAWLDVQVREMAAMGMKPWICLSYGNPVWGSGRRIGQSLKLITDRPEAFEAWLRYCAACVARYKDVVDEWEIWNEPFKEPYAYAELFYRTAKAVRAVQPHAKCYVTSLGMEVAKEGQAPVEGPYGIVLEKLRRENALDLASLFIYHPYTPNPDTSYETFAEPLRALVKSYSPAFDIFQGEVGCPSQLEYDHAIHSIGWTEYSQAKWNLRRTVGDAVRGIPSSVFTCVDLQYPNMLQSFGLLRCNLLKKVVYRRPNFYAMQHVFSYFDADVRPVGVSKQLVNGKELTVATFERQAKRVYALWFSGARPGDAMAYERGDVALEGFAAARPAWADLLTGKVCAFPKGNVAERPGARTVLKDVPLWDSPVLLADGAAIPLGGAE